MLASHLLEYPEEQHQAWGWGGVGRRNTLLGAGLQWLSLSGVKHCKTWGARAEGLHRKGESKWKGNRWRSTGLCFVWDLQDTVDGVRGKEGPLAHRG